MSAVDDMSGDGDPNLTAAEYVLGVLDAQARGAAERRIAADPAFAAEVQAWEARLAPLADAVPMVTPPSHVWDAIQRSLPRPAAPARRTTTAQARVPRARLWNSLGFWRGLSAVSLAAAAASVAMLVTTPQPRPPQPQPASTVAVAVLGPTGGPAAFFVSYDPASSRLVVAPAAAQAKNRSPQLWLLPPGGQPRSLGVLVADRPLAIAAPGSITVAPGAALAVSLEPLGGSPTGLPTGPVIAQGVLQQL